MGKYKITTIHTVTASSQEEALRKVAMITAAKPSKKSNNVNTAKQLADDMIEVAVKYAKKWGKESGVCFVTMYGTNTQGIQLMDASQVSKYMTKQKANLIDIIENDGVASSGVLKGKEFDLEDGDFEDKAFEIFLRCMVRMGFGVAASNKAGEKLLLEVFHKVIRAKGTDSNLATEKEKGKKGCDAGISAIARLSPTNLKPAYMQGVAGWTKMFKKLNEAA